MRLHKILFLLITLLFIGLVSGSCHKKPTTKTEDTSYLTPPLPATVNAYRSDQPIKTKFEAAIAARQDLRTSRLQPVQEPRVLSVEAITLAEAHQRLDQPGDNYFEDRPGDTPVWLVVFDGYLQLFPPDPEHTITPAPPHYGCIRVVLDAIDSSRAEISGSKCPPCQSGICLTPMPTLTESPPAKTPQP